MSSVMEQLTDAWNAHDAARVAALFAADYASVQPTHPARGFTGSTQVRDNWAAVFEGVPDFRAVLVSWAVAGDADPAVEPRDEWGEVDWSGRHVDGSPFAMRGVIIATVRGGRIAAARLYVEPVEAGGDDIDDAVDMLYRPPR